MHDGGSLLGTVTRARAREIGPIGTASRTAGGLAAITAIWSFFGASMVVAAVRGYAGCEVLAIPNAITGRTDRIGCILYSPIDAVEARATAGRPRPVGADPR